MTATPSPPTASVSCPSCGAVQAPGARFCNACGVSLSAPTSGPSAPAPGPSAPAPPAGSDPDLRQRVDDDRGILKRLQLLIPGFRGYRLGEDIRVADSLLRRQVADKVKNARTTIENSRAGLANAGQFQLLNDLAPLVADLMRLEGEIRAAEQGYTGISPAVRANPPQLDRLYEYDYGFAQAADQLNQTVAPLPSLVMGSNADPSSLAGVVAAARTQVSQLDQAFKARLQVIEGIRVS
jgi:hypothetical protein